MCVWHDDCIPSPYLCRCLRYHERYTHMCVIRFMHVCATWQTQYLCAISGLHTVAAHLPTFEIPDIITCVWHELCIHALRESSHVCVWHDKCVSLTHICRRLAYQERPTHLWHESCIYVWHDLFIYVCDIAYAYRHHTFADVWHTKKDSLICVWYESCKYVWHDSSIYVCDMTYAYRRHTYSDVWGTKEGARGSR